MDIGPAEHYGIRPLQALYLLSIDAPLLSVDATSFDDADYERIRQAVQVHLDTA